MKTKYLFALISIAFLYLPSAHAKSDNTHLIDLSKFEEQGIVLKYDLIVMSPNTHQFKNPSAEFDGKKYYIDHDYDNGERFCKSLGYLSDDRSYIFNGYDYGFVSPTRVFSVEEDNGEFFIYLSNRRKIVRTKSIVCINPGHQQQRAYLKKLNQLSKSGDFEGFEKLQKEIKDLGLFE